MTRRVTMVAALVCTFAAVALAGGPPWVKWDQAKAMAAATGKPILVYSNVDAEGGGC